MIRHSSFVILLLWLSSAVPSHACNVPVFRYALERWPAAPYEVVLFHRGPLAGPEQAARDLLEQAPTAQFANLTVLSVDLSANVEEPMQKLWQQQTNASLPWMVVRFPESDPDSPPAWAGPLSANAVKSLIESPARQEITQRLLKGESAVWALLESGHPPQDDATFTLLSTELKKLEATLELPPPAPDDPRMRSSLPLRMAFSVVRIGRQDPAEEMLVRLFLGGEKESAGAADSIAFPIFGRGRMLVALPRKELTPKVIAEACSFMSGACSCEVKELSPGRDLLLAANWTSIFDSSEANEPEKAKLPRPVIAAAPVGAKPSGVLAAATPPTPPASQPRFSRAILLTGIGLAAVLVAITGLMALRAKPRP